MYKKPLNVLFVARDMGSAGQIAALVEVASRYGVLSHVIVEGQAVSHISMRGLAHSTAVEWLGIHPNANTLLDAIDVAAKKFGQLRIAAVVCGRSSTENIGAEYITLRAAKQFGIPSIVIQDFWGDVWAEDCHPDHYFVIDDLAAQLTLLRTNSAVHVIGSPKHAQYADIDFASLRNKGRRSIGTHPDTQVIGFFGQDLLHLAGYCQVLRDIGTIVSQNHGLILFYKPHPRETQISSAQTLALFRSVGVNPLLVENDSVETLLASADVVLSCFSTVALDAAYMMCNRESPAVSIVCADYPGDVSDYWQPATGLSAFPLVSEGIALPANDLHSLEAAINKGLTVGESQRQLVRCRLLFNNAGTPVEKAFTVIDKITSVSVRKGS